jgi:rRNA maturation endonuclease Nob1
MNNTIHQNRAVVCVRIACRLIYEQNETQCCPGCGYQGILFSEIERYITETPISTYVRSR